MSEQQLKGTPDGHLLAAHEGRVACENCEATQGAPTDQRHQPSPSPYSTLERTIRAKIPTAQSISMHL